MATALAVLAASTHPLSAGPFTYTFKRLTNTSSSDVASQLSVVVSDAGVFTGNGNPNDDKYKGRNQVTFKFLNNVGTASSITDVYFDDGSLLDLVTVSSSSGVNMSEVATPSNLPGGKDIGFNTSKGFSADSETPILANGVNTKDEWVTLTFVLKSGMSYDDTIDAIEMSLDPKNQGTDIEGGLRIGVHVQGIGADGKSDSYYNGDQNNSGQGNDVPEPATMTLFGVGFAGMVGFGWRRWRRQSALSN
jgi:hypothetical protein